MPSFIWGWHSASRGFCCCGMTLLLNLGVYPIWAVSAIHPRVRLVADPTVHVVCKVGAYHPGDRSELFFSIHPGMCSVPVIMVLAHCLFLRAGPITRLMPFVLVYSRCLSSQGEVGEFPSVFCPVYGWCHSCSWCRCPWLAAPCIAIQNN